MRKVLYLSHATPEVYAIIREAVPAGFELLTLERDSDDERRAKIADCDVVIVAATPFRRAVIEHARKLTLVHHQGVGWQDTTDHEILKARGLPLALTPEGTTLGVAEHTVLLMLAVLKLLPHADAELRQGRFHINALRPMSRELHGMTVGYIGMGRIAQAVVERLRAFGTKGIYFDPNVPAFEGLARKPLEEVLQESDIVSLHLPLTAQTRNLIGPAQIARMKPGAYIVNTARGEFHPVAPSEHAVVQRFAAIEPLDVCKERAHLRFQRVAGARRDVRREDHVSQPRQRMAVRHWFGLEYVQCRPRQPS